MLKKRNKYFIFNHLPVPQHSRLESRPGDIRVAHSDLGFRRLILSGTISGFLHQSQLASLELPTIGQKNKRNKIPNPRRGICFYCKDQVDNIFLPFNIIYISFRFTDWGTCQKVRIENVLPENLHISLKVKQKALLERF